MSKNYGPKTPAGRVCLGVGCGKLFQSKGPGNRKCPKCARKSVEQSRAELFQAADIRRNG